MSLQWRPYIVPFWSSYFMIHLCETFSYLKHSKYLVSLWFKKKNASFPPLVSVYTFDKAKQCIGTTTIEIDFLQKKSIDSNPYDTDKMAAEFIQQFNNQAFSVGQQVVWNCLSFLSLSRHSNPCRCPKSILLGWSESNWGICNYF